MVFSLKIKGVLCCFSLVFCLVKAQHQIDIKASLDTIRQLTIKQEITFKNTSKDTLSTIYLHDWINAYAFQYTPLTKKLAEEFDNSLFLAKNKDKGYTHIYRIVEKNKTDLKYHYTQEGDIIKIELERKLPPGETVSLWLHYKSVLPNAKYTGYGYHRDEYELRYWYIWPCVYEDGFWKKYSHKNLDDGYFLKSKYQISITIPKKYKLFSNFPIQKKITRQNGIEYLLSDNQERKECKIQLKKAVKFATYPTDKVVLTSDFDVDGYSDASKLKSAKRIMNFMEEKLGEYPYKNLSVTQFEYDRYPLYGLNQLPSFIQPYSKQFQYELGLLKNVLNNVLEESLNYDPRANYWIKDALHNYLLMEYVKIYYPKSKLIGKFANNWLLKGYHFAKVDFNEQYTLLYNVLSRRNQEQSLITPKDSLIKYNANIANRYKAGFGLHYLGEYIGKSIVDRSIKELYKRGKEEKANGVLLEEILNQYTDKNIDWFFDSFVETNHSIDYKIKKSIKKKDSLEVYITNKTGTKVPISLFGLKEKDAISSKYWLKPFLSDTTITIPFQEEKKLVLNYDQVVPEINQRNNWHSVNGFFGNHRKIKFTFFQDIENSFHNQIFYVPIAEFNAYDGLFLGMRLHNQSFLRSPFIYNIVPSYGLASKSLIGGGSFSYTHFFKNQKLYAIRFGVTGTTFHYAPDLRYYSLTPSMLLGFRPKEDLRSNKREVLLMRYVNIFRDTEDTTILADATDPDYSILNLRYRNYEDNSLNHFSYFIDLQFSNKFSKVSFNGRYRKLFYNGTQINTRVFFGKFLVNRTNSDFFSYALDRPTDYLFDYKYLGRSEDSGLFSQQIIIGEGGFKSRLDQSFANDWILTTNMGINIWQYVEAYGDLGYIKNKGIPAKFVYGSGIRLNLLRDYFELYFPVYSSNGWEIAQPQYEKKIRFLVTLDLSTLGGLFTRKWF